MRHLLLTALLLLSGLTPARAEEPTAPSAPPVFTKEGWEAWRREELAPFKREAKNNPFALLGVAELRPGERAYLSLKEKPRAKGWARTQPAGPSVEFTYNDHRLKLDAPGEKRDNFLKGAWKAPNGMELDAGGDSRGYVWVYAYDQKQNKFKEKLMPFFPYAPEAVVKAKLDRTRRGEAAKMPDSQGGVREMKLGGELVFTYAGKEQRLRSYLDAKNPLQLLITFKDDTNGKESYGGGRYVAAALESESADVATIDFNRATHPYCLYSPYFSCPLVVGNKIDGAVRAGVTLPPGYAAGGAH